MTEFLWRHVDNSSRDRDVVQRVGRSVFQGFSNAIRVSTSNKATTNGSRFKKVTVYKMRGLALIFFFLLLMQLLQIMGQSNESKHILRDIHSGLIYTQSHELNPPI